MKHDIFEFNMSEMSGWDIFWRVAFLLTIIGITAMDLFVWRPA